MYHKVLISLTALLLVAGGLYAVQSGSKSTGLSQVGEIDSFEDVEKHLLEIHRALDFIHRELLDDVDTINRDELPAVQADVDALTVRVDFDIPMVRDCDFRYLATNKVEWDAGSLEFGGATYTITAGSSDEGDMAVYVDVSSLSSPVTLGHVATATVVDDRWYLAWRNDTTVYTAIQSPIIHGGLVQANTLAADTIVGTAVIVGGAATDVNDGATVITPGKVYVHASDDDTLDDWSQLDAGTTYIKGGKIYADSITIGQIGSNAVSDDELNSSKLNGVESGATADQTSTEIIDATGWEYTTTTEIDGGKIRASTVTADRISTATLSAITADMGTITAGTISAGTVNADTVTTGTLTVGNSTINVGTGAVNIPDDVTIGQLNGSSEGSQITTVDYSGTDYLDFRTKRISSGEYYLVTYGATDGGTFNHTFPGILGYTRTGSWPTESFGTYGTLKISPAIVQCVAAGLGKTTASGLPVTLDLPDQAAGRLGYGSTQIDITAAGVVSVPVAAIAALSSYMRVEVETYEGNGSGTLRTACTFSDFTPDLVIILDIDGGDNQPPTFVFDGGDTEHRHFNGNVQGAGKIYMSSASLKLAISGSNVNVSGNTYRVYGLKFS